MDASDHDGRRLILQAAAAFCQYEREAMPTVWMVYSLNEYLSYFRDRTTKLLKIGHSAIQSLGNAVKKSDLTAKQKLFVSCPVCAAGTGEHCKMYSRFGPRKEPHAERKYFAMQTIEHDQGAVIQTGRSRRGGPDRF
jgi:hypothetical protein